MSVTAPADRRLLRGQVKPRRRRASRRAWWPRAWRAGAAVALLAAGVGLAVQAVASPVFAVRRIDVRGNSWLSAAEVRRLVDGLAGRSVLTADLGAWRRRLLASPWIGDATLRRVLPSTIEIVVRERRPLGVARIDGALFLVDEQGAVIDRYGPRYAALDLVVIDGIGGATGEDGALDRRRVGLAARVLRSVGRQPSLARRISQIDVSDPRDAVVILERDSALLRLGDDEFLERLRAYAEVESTLRERVPAIDYVDLRFGAQVFVGPASASSAAAPGRRPGAPPVP